MNPKFQLLTVVTTVISNHTIEMEPNLRHAAPPPPPARSQAANKQQIIVTKQDWPSAAASPAHRILPDGSRLTDVTQTLNTRLLCPTFNGLYLSNIYYKVQFYIFSSHPQAKVSSHCIVVAKSVIVLKWNVLMGRHVTITETRKENFSLSSFLYPISCSLEQK